jgi:hypothetical protein
MPLKVARWDCLPDLQSHYRDLKIRLAFTCLYYYCKPMLAHPTWKCFIRCSGAILALLSVLCAERSRAAGVEITPFQVADGPFQIVTIDAKPYYQVLNFNGSPAWYLYYDVPGSFTVTGQPLYVQVFYLEYGYGALRVEYDSNHTSATLLQQEYWDSEESYGTFCTNGRGPREAVFKLESPLFQGRQNGGADFRIDSGNLGGERLTVEKVFLWTTPPPFFSANSTSPWLQPYSGPERTDIDTTTLNGKVLCGYQGWFNTPSDAAEIGYSHWSRDPFGVTSATVTVDYWPEIPEYDPADLQLVSGMTLSTSQPAYLYSSYRRGATLKHFQWMREYGIDGVFLSRFVGATTYPKYFRMANMVLNHVREGCHVKGRTWAMMYDVSGTWPGMSTADLINDWKFLCDQVHVRQDLRYLWCR